MEDHATWDLRGMYKANVMNRMAGEHVGSWDHEGGAWSEEEMREVHVRRLRGPWGRLYAKELRKLRRLVRALDDQLFDVDAFEAAMLEREFGGRPWALVPRRGPAMPNLAGYALCYVARSGRGPGAALRPPDVSGPRGSLIH